MQSPERSIVELYYNAARAEIIERMKLRDQALVLYATGVSAVTGFAAGGAVDVEILLLIPFLAFVSALIANHHSEATGALGYYCARELARHMPAEVPQWDHSWTLRAFRSGAIRHRLLGESLLLLVPPALALWHLAQRLDGGRLLQPTTTAVAWWLALVLLAATMTLQALTLRARRGYYERTWSEDDAS